MIEDHHTADGARSASRSHPTRGGRLRPSVVRRQRGRDGVMEPASFSAFAALAGSMIGGLTSLTASWLTQYVQFRAQQRAHDVSRREQLYAHCIDEASRLYTEAYEHEEAEVAKLVTLYA